MKRTLIPAVAVLVLAACSSGPPPQSAAAACRDFNAWFLAVNDDTARSADASQLARAVQEAPTGHLYADLSQLQDDAKSARSAHGVNRTEAQQAALLEVNNVDADCADVNPAG